MSQSNTKTKMNPWLKAALLAVGSAGLYAAVFVNEASVIKYYTKGSFYAALPVLTAFAFSIIHGAFASQCLEVMGLTASKSTMSRVNAEKQKQSVARKDKRPRLQVT